MNPFDTNKFYEATNGGLDFFLQEFSAEIASNRGRFQGFRVRPNSEDKTGSCSLWQSEQGIYFFRDWGVMDKGLNAIDYVMYRDNCDFISACKKLFTAFNIEVEKSVINKPIVKFSSKTTQKQGYWAVDFFNEIQHTDYLRRIFPFYNDYFLKEYHFKEVKTYENVGFSEAKNDLFHRKVTATDDFPIFGYDEVDFVKLYQPSAPKKDKYINKHSFIGEKPKRIIYGWKRLFQKAKDLDADEKLNAVIIATGGSDGINIATLGYDVIWFNSETEIITKEEYYQLTKIAENIYYVPDNDKTGIAQAKKMGLLHLDLKIVWLPTQINKGSHILKIKDFRDWIFAKKQEPIDKVAFLFSRMLRTALNFKFWEVNNKGAVTLHNKKLENFLIFQDFLQYKEPYKTTKRGKEDDSVFIHIDNNKMRQVFPSDIKRFVLDWLGKGFHSLSVYNKVFSSRFFTQNTLKNLKKMEYTETFFGENYQYYLFENTAVKVTENKVEPIKYEHLDFSFWKDRIIKRPFKLMPNFFETYTDDNNNLRVKVLNNSSNYLKVLINTSRIYWQKDSDKKGQDTNRFNINSPNLEDAENIEQEQHLLNKIYCIGYLLHFFKVKSKAKMVLGVDFKFGENLEGSFGGTGKSFITEVLTSVLDFLQGSTDRDNKFPFDGVTEKTNIVYLDDFQEGFYFKGLFSKITNVFEANHKGGVIYKIPFEKSPKMVGTTNFPPDLSEPSINRRVLAYICSDYYHEKTGANDYLFTRKISDDFNGQDIMVPTSTNEEWNADYNFMMQCLAFYLAQENVISAPLGSILTRNLVRKIGDRFMEWADDYFADDSKFNTKIAKSEVLDNYKMQSSSSTSSQFMTKHLALYCDYKGYDFNPIDLQDSKGQIRGIINSTMKNCYYIGKKQTEKEDDVSPF